MHSTFYVRPGALLLRGAGTKQLLQNGPRYRYDASKWLLVSMALPVVGEIVEASHNKPYLGFSMEIDLSEVAKLIIEADLSLSEGANSQRGLSVSPITEGLVDAAVRLRALLRTTGTDPRTRSHGSGEILSKLLPAIRGPLDT